MTAHQADREAVVQAVEGAMRDVVRFSVAGTEEEWRRDAETVADAALAAMEKRGRS